MPEGHTIHRLARFLRRDLAGRPIESSSPQGRFTGGSGIVDGEVVTTADAHGKHLFVRFDGGTVVHVHLGLFGRFRRRANPPPEPRGALRWRLVGAERTWDLSGPTACEILDPDEEDALHERLGPDPLRPRTDPAPFVDRVRRSRRAIADLLLDQEVVAGIGNVYRAELLFLLGIDPHRQGRSLGEDELGSLWDLTVAELRDGERLGRIVTVDADTAGVPKGRIPRGERLWVYKVDRCRCCGSEIAVDEVAARTLYWCPSCQSG